jgi:hypothetical protein
MGAAGRPGRGNGLTGRAAACGILAAALWASGNRWARRAAWRGLGSMAAASAAASLADRRLLHVFMLETPQPVTFFVWITALADVIVVAAPFGQPAPLASKVFTAVINLVAGVAVISLLTGVARGAVRPRPAALRPARTCSPGDRRPAGPLSLAARPGSVSAAAAGRPTAAAARSAPGAAACSPACPSAARCAAGPDG